MKILEIIPTLESGGAEKFVVELSNEFSNIPNTEIHLLTFYNTSQDIFRGLLSDKVILHTFNKSSGFNFKIFFKLYKLIKELKPDVVHSHINAFNYLPFSIFLQRKVRFFHTIHSDAYKEANKIGRFIRKIAFKCHLCQAIAISDKSQESFISCYNSDLPLIVNGCSYYRKNTTNLISKFRITNTTKVLINVARIVPVKNQAMLLKVCNRLIKEGQDIVILIIGRIGDQTVYNEICHYFDNHRIIHLGEVENPRDYMSQADYYCLSSIYEGLPISLLEAFSVNLIPICTPVGGIVNLIKNGTNGFLTEEVTEDSFYNTLKKALMIDEEKKMAMKSIMKKDFEDYTMKKCAEHYLDLFVK